MKSLFLNASSPRRSGDRSPRLASSSRWWRSLLALGLVAVLTLGTAGDALAARSGGRMGGGSFRRSVPSQPSRAPGGGYRGGYGGGFGFPFLIPIFGFGGGGLFSLLIMIAVFGFLANVVRNLLDQGGGGGGAIQRSSGGYGRSSVVSVAQVRVGLLAAARSLQQDLDRIAQTANTSTSAGRSQMLQETMLSLLRHPEYWVYGSAESDRTDIATAEAAFNRLSLAERSKFSAETVSNYNSGSARLGAAESQAIAVADDAGPSEYIVVTILVGTESRLDLPATVESSDQMRQALSRLGAIAAEDLLTVEILWTPQAEGDTLTTDDIIENYPDLRLV